MDSLTNSLGDLEFFLNIYGVPLPRVKKTKVTEPSCGTTSTSTCTVGTEARRLKNRYFLYRYGYPCTHMWPHIHTGTHTTVRVHVSYTGTHTSNIKQISPCYQVPVYVRINKYTHYVPGTCTCSIQVLYAAVC